MLIPGNFSVPQPYAFSNGGNEAPCIKFPKKALRIARIYVSQRTTVYNGRLNWIIPKHLARFEFSAPPTTPGTKPPESLTVQVFPPDSKAGDEVKPPFRVTLTP
ncbi:hypothetical protein EK21DRAFT_109306 [Setomelanomma holmii]|uniref:Uncharacterized protein n=1 Tax=Setomelanomma holmii TaxID=210430 RepID=A0A9P4HH48_9PLEO|nr:hypothetical protein EK21DRAFT_109306 [Setomelanomma holmii]